MRRRSGIVSAVIGGVLAITPAAATSGPISLLLPGYFGLVGNNSFYGGTTSPDFSFDDGTYGFSVGFGANPHIGASLHGDGTDHFLTEDGLGYVVGLAFAAGSNHYDGQVVTATLDYTYSYAISAAADDSASATMVFRGSDGGSSDLIGGFCGFGFATACGSFSGLVGHYTNAFTLAQQTDGSFLSDTFEVDMYARVITHGFQSASAYIDPAFSINAAGNPALDGARFYYSPGVTDASAAPEPAGWAMLTVGFGAIGAALRGRRSPLRRLA